MALISKENTIEESVRCLRKLPEDGGIVLFSYKRNRSVTILKSPDRGYQLVENGYNRKEYEVSTIAALQKKLKSLINREFRRSRKIRLYKISTPEDLSKNYQKI